jgi:hypothetical protein
MASSRPVSTALPSPRVFALPWRRLTKVSVSMQASAQVIISSSADSPKA